LVGHFSPLFSLFLFYSLAFTVYFNSTKSKIFGGD